MSKYLFTYVNILIYRVYIFKYEVSSPRFVSVWQKSRVYFYIPGSVVHHREVQARTQDTNLMEKPREMQPFVPFGSTQPAYLCHSDPTLVMGWTLLCQLAINEMPYRQAHSPLRVFLRRGYIKHLVFS